MPRLIGLILLLVAISGCRTPAMSRVALRKPIQRSAVESLPAESMSTLSSSKQASIPAATDPDENIVNIPIQPVSATFFESDSPAACCPPTASDEFRLKQDLRNFGPMLWEDTRGLMQVENGLILGVSLAAAIGIRQDIDDKVRESVDDNPTRWGDATRVLGYLGEAQYQVPVLLGLWGYSVHNNDAELHHLSESLISAYTINGLATLAIKGATDTDRPDADWNGGRWGFPSFHAGSAFTIGAVLEEYYGWRAGLPAYTLAALISWSRIDQQDHDLSDVVFAAAMGWVIGKSVASQHLRGNGRVRIYPWRHPTEVTLGMAVETRF